MARYLRRCRAKRGRAQGSRVLLKAGLTRQGERTFSHPALAGEGPMAWFEAHYATWHL